MSLVFLSRSDGVVSKTTFYELRDTWLARPLGMGSDLSCARSCPSPLYSWRHPWLHPWHTHIPRLSHSCIQANTMEVHFHSDSSNNDWGVRLSAYGIMQVQLKKNRLKGGAITTPGARQCGMLLTASGGSCWLASDRLLLVSTMCPFSCRFFLSLTGGLPARTLAVSACFSGRSCQIRQASVRLRFCPSCELHVRCPWHK